jgi:hypothetical protein
MNQPPNADLGGNPGEPRGRRGSDVVRTDKEKVVDLDTELDPDRDISVKVLLNQTRDVFDCGQLPSRSGRAARRSSCAEHPPITTRLKENPTEYVVNVSLTFSCRSDAEQAEMQLATTAFNGLVTNWSEVEEVRW